MDSPWKVALTGDYVAEGGEVMVGDEGLYVMAFDTRDSAEAAMQLLYAQYGLASILLYDEVRHG